MKGTAVPILKSSLDSLLSLPIGARRQEFKARYGFEIPDERLRDFKFETRINSRGREVKVSVPGWSNFGTFLPIDDNFRTASESELREIMKGKKTSASFSLGPGRWSRQSRVKALENILSSSNRYIKELRSRFAIPRREEKKEEKDYGEIQSGLNDSVYHRYDPENKSFQPEDVARNLKDQKDFQKILQDIGSIIIDVTPSREFFKALDNMERAYNKLNSFKRDIEKQKIKLAKLEKQRQELINEDQKRFQFRIDDAKERIDDIQYNLAHYRDNVQKLGEKYHIAKSQYQELEKKRELEIKAKIGINLDTIFSLNEVFFHIIGEANQGQNSINMFEHVTSKHELLKKITKFEKGELLTGTISEDQVRFRTTHVSVILISKNESKSVNRFFNIREGSTNCVVQLAMDFINSKAPRKAAIKHLENINKEVQETGVDNEIMQKISNKTEMKITCYDRDGDIWHHFEPLSRDGKIKDSRWHIKMTLHNDHAELKDEFDKKMSCPDGFHQSEKIEIQWVEKDHEFPPIDTKNERAMMSGDIEICRKIFLEDKEIHVKRKFDSYETYPKCFSDAGVFKAKLCEMIPDLEVTLKSKFDNIMRNASMAAPVFCAREIKPDEDRSQNYHFDKNEAYRSGVLAAKSEGKYWRGFFYPTAHLSVNLKSSEFDWSLIDNVNGIMKINTKDFKSFLVEGTFWEPIPICQRRHDNGVKFDILEILIGPSFDFEFGKDKFTKKEFTRGVGKCWAKTNTRIFKTSSLCEMWHMVIKYKKLLKFVKTRRIRCGVDKYERAKYKNEYLIEHMTDDQPWNMRAINIFVLAYHRMYMADQINKVQENGFDIVRVKTDSIEIERQDGKDPISLFDLGQEIGQWKQYDPKPLKNTEHAYGWVKLNHEIYKEDGATVSISDRLGKIAINMIKNRTTFLSGAAGTGKTYLLKELKACIPDLQFLAPTHKACDMLLDFSKTYHKYFNMAPRTEYKEKELIPKSDIEHIIKDAEQFKFIEEKSEYTQKKFAINGFSPVAIDEVSMVPKEVYKYIMLKLKGLVIVSGDFAQLPPVESESCSKLVEKLPTINLTEVKRQSSETKYSDYFKVIEIFRPENLKKASKKDIELAFTYLNDRVIKTNINKKDFEYIIAGTNREVDLVNGKTENGDRVRSSETFYFQRNNENYKISKGTEGIYCDDKVTIEATNMRTLERREFILTYSPTRYPKALAQTIHCMQGTTVRGKLLIMTNNIGFVKNHLYVALSRVTKKENLFLTGKLTTRSLG